VHAVAALWHRRDVSRRQLRIDTFVLRRDLWSGNVTVAPAAEPAMICHGEADQALNELRVLTSVVLGDSRPTRISRHVLPAETELASVTVPIVRKLLPPRLREPLPVAFTCVVIPQQRDAWVMVPAIGHTFYLSRGEDLEAVARAEIARVLAAADPDGTSLPGLLPAATTSLVPLDVFVTADAAAAHASRKAAVEAERRAQAEDTLDASGERLHVRLARRGGIPLVGRDRAIAELEALLGGNDRLAVLLVGDEAVGKTALVESWAARHPRRAAWITSIAQLVAGASGLGEWQERVGKVLAAAELLDAVLYLDDFGALFADKPEEGGVDVAAAMRRHVTGGRVRLLGEITPTALERAERRDVALLGAMTRLRLEPLDPATTVSLLEARAAQWARAEPNRPSVALEALAPVVELARRYLPYRAFPGKAVRFLEELRATRETERDPSGRPTALGLEEAYEAFSLVTGIPAFLLRDDRELKLDDVIAKLRRRMIGQDEAVKRVAETICVAKAQLGPADKPLATFLFVGPTGVGKTELARSLADLLFGGEGRLVRFDMSEYGDPWAAERLITGGSEVRDGLLTAKVREQPFCVVLLDEIEKAHPTVFDLLLQVLGEGRLTDGRGRTTFFQNAIIVMTSNLGAATGRGAIGISGNPDAASRDRAAELERYRTAVASAFRPEMVNRIDRVIAFHRLERVEVAAVARLQAAKIAGRRGLAGAGIVVDITDAALDQLAEGGYSAQWGVRALRRHLDDAMVAPLARLLGKLGADAKGTLVHVRAAGEALPADLPIGGQLASVERAGLAIGVHRRSRASSRRAVSGVIGASDARRATDRLMRMPAVAALVDHLGWLRGQLVTIAAQRRERRREALSSEQLQSMQAELARLDATYQAADDVRTEIRTIEELALTALAANDDADELVGGVDELAARFRRRFFHVLTARLAGKDSVTLVAHGVDHQAGLHRWARGLIEDAARRGYRVAAHLRSSAGLHAGWPETRSWGHPRPPKEIVEQLDRGANVRSLLLRIDGAGAGALYGLEVGTHRWRGLAAVDPCHVVVELVAMRTTFNDAEWLAAALAAAWPTHPPRGEARREHDNEQGVWIRGKAQRCEVPWPQYFERLEEIALADALDAMTDDDKELEELYAGALDVAVEGGTP